MNRNPKYYQRFTFIISGCLAILLVLGTPLLSRPTNATAVPLSAAITLDGRSIFQVTDSTEFTAQERANLITTQLQSAVLSSEPLQVEVKERNDLPTLWLNERYLLTVTNEDVPPGSTAMEQATLWATQLQRAVNQAQKERSMDYIKDRLLRSLIIVITVWVVNWGLGWLWFGYVQRGLISLGFTPPPGTDDAQSQRFHWLLNLTLKATRLGIWVATLIYITNLFPLTRQLSYQLKETIIATLTAPIITLAGRSYSIPNLIILMMILWGLIFGVNTFTQLFRLRVLQAAGINRGLQEGIVIITKYGLIFIGTIVLLQIWGFDLTSLTLLASALGVGIGFGFQDIAKNFGSGLVLLFERPIQVGDFVEVGQYQGTVERLGARSTIIRTLDQVSIIVPNSRFLESELINWDHENPVSGVRLPVGVAYNSDLNQVRDALLAAAYNHPDVLSIPTPQVLFKGFGDNSLDFELRVWLAQPSKQAALKSDLYFRIEDNFRQSKIEMPFPQRDLHLRSGQLPIQLSPEIHEFIARWLHQQVQDQNNQES